MTLLVILGSIVAYALGMAPVVHRLGKWGCTMSEDPALLFGALLWPVWVPAAMVFYWPYKMLAFAYAKGVADEPLVDTKRIRGRVSGLFANRPQKQRLALPECECSAKHPPHDMPPKQGAYR